MFRLVQIVGNPLVSTVKLLTRLFRRQSCPIATLDVDCLLFILDHLLLRDLIRAGGVCLLWHELVTNKLKTIKQLTLLIAPIPATPKCTPLHFVGLERRLGTMDHKLQDYVHLGKTRLDTLWLISPIDWQDREELNHLLKVLPNIANLTIAQNEVSSNSVPALCDLMEKWPIRSLRFYFRFSDEDNATTLAPNFDRLFHTLNHQLPLLDTLVLFEKDYHKYSVKLLCPILGQLKNISFNIDPLVHCTVQSNYTQYAVSNQQLSTVWQFCYMKASELLTFPSNFAAKFRSICVYNLKDLAQFRQLCSRFSNLTALRLAFLNGLVYCDVLEAMSTLSELKEIVVNLLYVSTVQKATNRNVTILPKLKHLSICMQMKDCYAPLTGLQLSSAFPRLEALLVECHWLGSQTPRPCDACKRKNPWGSSYFAKQKHKLCRVRVKQTLESLIRPDVKLFIRNCVSLT